MILPDEKMTLPAIPEMHPMSNHTASVLREVADERHRQLSLWGDQLHSQLVWLSILGEEFGEVGRAINEKNEQEYRAELVEVAAVAVAAVESLDKNKTLERRGDLLARQEKANAV